MLGQRTNGSYEQDSVRSGEEVSCKTLTQTNQKSKKTDKCIVSGYRPKAGVVDQGTTNLVCRQHEFGMGHLRDPAACYLDSTLSEYRRLRPRQKRFLFFFLLFSSQDFPVKRDVEKQIFQTRCRTTSPTLTTSDRSGSLFFALSLLLCCCALCSMSRQCPRARELHSYSTSSLMSAAPAGSASVNLSLSVQDWRCPYTPQAQRSSHRFRH